jgi:hypothetical protein
MAQAVLHPEALTTLQKGIPFRVQRPFIPQMTPIPQPDRNLIGGDPPLEPPNPPVLESSTALSPAALLERLGIEKRHIIINLAYKF